MLVTIAYIVLAILLFRIVNWLGEHATEFGYGSTTLFEAPNESIAFNFFIRSIFPAVFIILISSGSVALGIEEFRLGIIYVVVYYFILRFAYIFIMGLQRLVSWPRFLLHFACGMGASWAAYIYLILPNRALLPDIDTMANELWLAIFAFLYAATNKATTSRSPHVRRKNKYITKSYDGIRKKIPFNRRGVI